MKKRLLGLLCVFFLLGACASPRFTDIRSLTIQCKTEHTRFSNASECIKNKIPVKENAIPKDNYVRTRLNFINEINSLNNLIKTKKITEQNAYNRLESYITFKIEEERKQDQVAGAAIAVMAVSAAAIACADSGNCGGGGGYSSSYSGNCPCPYDIDSAGNRCGERSAYTRNGGASPICTAGHIYANER